MKVQLKNVRLAFPNLFEAKGVGDGGDVRFSAAAVIEPGSANAKALAGAVKAVAEEKWKDKAGAILADLQKKERVCYKESPLAKDGVIYDGFEGMHALNASNKVRPTVIDRDKTPLVAEDGRPYGGCYVNMIVDVWAQDNQYGKRINASLTGVQFVEDGDAFGGGGVASADDFDTIEEAPSEEALA